MLASFRLHRRRCTQRERRHDATDDDRCHWLPHTGRLPAYSIIQVASTPARPNARAEEIIYFRRRTCPLMGYRLPRIRCRIRPRRRVVDRLHGAKCSPASRPFASSRRFRALPNTDASHYGAAKVAESMMLRLRVFNILLLAKRSPHARRRRSYTPLEWQ